MSPIVSAGKPWNLLSPKNVVSNISNLKGIKLSFLHRPILLLSYCCCFQKVSNEWIQNSWYIDEELKAFLSFNLWIQAVRGFKCPFAHMFINCMLHWLWGWPKRIWTLAASKVTSSQHYPMWNFKYSLGEPVSVWMCHANMIILFLFFFRVLLPSRINTQTGTHD